MFVGPRGLVNGLHAEVDVLQQVVYQTVHLEYRQTVRLTDFYVVTCCLSSHREKAQREREREREEMRENETKKRQGQIRQRQKRDRAK